jgi:hypothetical protein
MKFNPCGPTRHYPELKFPLTKQLATVGLLMMIFTLSAKLNAAPVLYSFTVAGQNAGPAVSEIQGPVIQLGSTTYGGVGKEIIVVFTFSGDTADVQPWSFAGTAGHEIRRGAAAVVISDQASGTILADGTFDPSAGIFVSIDDGNGGIGFGSQAVWPVTGTGFPGQPAYPLGNALGSSSTYDLTSSFSTTGSALSCEGFPGPCGASVSLPMSDGELFTMQLPTPNINTSFTANVVPLVTFSKFSAHTIAHSNGTFSLKGHFTLGHRSNGMNPVQEPFTLQINNYSATVPAGLFQETSSGSGSSGAVFSFSGPINGSPLLVTIRANGHLSYSIAAHGSGSIHTTGGVSVGLTIGDNTGTTLSTP